MNFRDRPRRIRNARAVRGPEASPRAFSLATELRVLAVGLFAVAGGALLLSRFQPVVPSEVAGAALVMAVVAAVNVAVGLRRARRAAGAIDAVER